MSLVPHPTPHPHMWGGNRLRPCPATRSHAWRYHRPEPTGRRDAVLRWRTNVAHRLGHPDPPPRVHVWRDDPDQHGQHPTWTTRTLPNGRELRRVHTPRLAP